MDVLRFIVGGVLPYLAVAVFVGGMIHRIMVWRRLPSPPITLFPAPPDGKANTLNTVK
jgi:nitrate reductase gamma subunit